MLRCLALEPAAPSFPATPLFGDLEPPPLEPYHLLDDLFSIEHPSPFFTQHLDLTGDSVFSFSYLALIQLACDLRQQHKEILGIVGLGEDEMFEVGFLEKQVLEPGP